MLTSVSKPHAVVIGAGLGGLAAAIRLGARGYRVTVVEKLDIPGGRAGVFKQDGFTFDAGPTIITVPQVFEELWSMAGRNFAADVTLKPVSPFYTIRFDDGSTFNAESDPEAMRREVARLSPGDVAGYDRFMADSEAIFKVGFEKLAHVPFTNLTDMLAIVPDLLKLQGWRSVYSHVAARVKDPRLRMALSFHPLFIGGNPFRATAIYSMIAHLERQYGVHWVKGGTNVLVQAMAKLIEWQNNKVRLNAGVARILHDGKRASGIELESGEVIAADLVVSNACAVNTYEKFLKGFNAKPTLRKLTSSPHSMSLFVWYFGTQKKFESVPHHIILMGPRYKELIGDIFDKKILANDMSLYLHRPTASDPNLAPVGCDTFYVLSPVPHLDAAIDWTTEAPRYKARIAKRLSETVLPGFESEIVSERIMTPLDFEGRLSSFKGAAFGLEPVLTQSAWFRPHNKGAGLENLYLVGAGTHPGAGVPGVISSARVLDSLIPHADELAHV
jgi:phytoene desaturase